MSRVIYRRMDQAIIPDRKERMRARSLRMRRGSIDFVPAHMIDGLLSFFFIGYYIRMIFGFKYVIVFLYEHRLHRMKSAGIPVFSSMQIFSHHWLILSFLKHC